MAKQKIFITQKRRPPQAEVGKLTGNISVNKLKTEPSAKVVALANASGKSITSDNDLVQAEEIVKKDVTSAMTRPPGMSRREYHSRLATGKSLFGPGAIPVTVGDGVAVTTSGGTIVTTGEKSLAQLQHARLMDLLENKGLPGLPDPPKDCNQTDECNPDVAKPPTGMAPNDKPTDPCLASMEEVKKHIDNHPCPDYSNFAFELPGFNLPDFDLHFRFPSFNLGLDWAIDSGFDNLFMHPDAPCNELTDALGPRRLGELARKIGGKGKPGMLNNMISSVGKVNKIPGIDKAIAAVGKNTNDGNKLNALLTTTGKSSMDFIKSPIPNILPGNRDVVDTTLVAARSVGGKSKFISPTGINTADKLARAIGTTKIVDKLAVTSSAAKTSGGCPLKAKFPKVIDTIPKSVTDAVARKIQKIAPVNPLAKHMPIAQQNAHILATKQLMRRSRMAKIPTSINTALPSFT